MRDKFEMNTFHAFISQIATDDFLLGNVDVSGSDVCIFLLCYSPSVHSNFEDCSYSYTYNGPGGSSGKVLDCGLDGLGPIPSVGGVEIFLHTVMSRLVLGSIQPPIK